MPSKGHLDQIYANATMNYLKKEHFNYGKSGSQFGFRASTAVGKHVRQAKSVENVPWANLQTHFGLGTD